MPSAAPAVRRSSTGWASRTTLRRQTRRSKRPTERPKSTICGTATTVPAADARIVVAVDPADARRRAALAAERAAGRFIATALVWPHESRLGPGTSPVARIVAAAAAGTDFDPSDLATAIDCGWTAEYVDPLWRLLQRPTAVEIAVATGTLLTGAEAARTAAAYFGRAAPPAVPPPVGEPGDAAHALATLGWRAVTMGDDLVTVLCEGAAGA